MDLNLYIIVAAATQRNGPAAKALALSLRDTDAREAEERAVEIMTCALAEGVDDIAD